MLITSILLICIWQHGLKWKTSNSVNYPVPLDLYQKAMIPRPLIIAGVVLQYWLVSISMVFVNKNLVGTVTQTKHDNRPDNSIPLVLTWIQCVASATLALLINMVSTRVLHPHSSHEERIVLADLARPLFHKLGMLFVGMLSFSQLCLQRVGIAFFTIARSTTLVFVVVFSAWLLRQRVTRGVLVCCAAIVCGFVLGVAQETSLGTLSVAGVVYGVSSSVCTALVGVYTKVALTSSDSVNCDPLTSGGSSANSSGTAASKDGGRKVEISPVKFLFLNNSLGSIYFLLPLFGSGEMWRACRILSLDDIVVAVLSGALGSAVGWASALQIKYTSPIAHHVSNGCKSAVLSLLGVVVYHEVKTGLWWVGCGLVLSGALVYAVLKSRPTKSWLPLTVSPLLLERNGPAEATGPLNSHSNGIVAREDRFPKDNVV